jgi:folate-binding protein YgfZ
MPESNTAWLDAISRVAPSHDRGDVHAGMVAGLDHLGVLAVTGADAENFLHNQLTNEVLGLPPGSMRLAGYCSAKGRLLATLLVWKSEDGVLLVMPRELLPGVQKRLQMFVLRSKVTLRDVSEDWVLIGMAQQDLQGAPSPGPSEGSYAPWPSAMGLHRALWIGPVAQALRVWETQTAQLPAASASRWRWLDIRAGLPMIVEATREQFVPQMVNFDLVDGVNFRKGCYPGQEVVARSQYLGKLKRRMLLASCTADTAAAGMEIFSDADPAQPCGMVVNAERGPENTWDLLVEIKLDAATTPVHLGSANADLLTFSALPYAIRDPK